MSKKNTKKIASIPVVGPKALALCLEAAFETKSPLMIWGPMGIGKSSIVYQSVLSMSNYLGEQCGFKDVRLTMCDPVDMRGIPGRKIIGKRVEPDGKTSDDVVTTFFSPENLPNEARDGKHGILMLDELPSAKPDVMVAAFQLILDRRLGDYILPDGWNIIAAGNREEDRSVVFEMPAPLANRFIHLEMETVFDEWKEWAYKNKIHPHVIGFLNFKTGMLFNFDPEHYDRAFPTPRSWEKTSKILSMDQNFNKRVQLASEVPTDVKTILVKGCVGEGPGGELMNFVRLANELSDPDDLIKRANNGEKIKWSEYKADQMYALCSAFSARCANGTAIKNVWTVINQLQGEFAVLCVKDALRCNPQGISSSKQYLPWAKKHPELAGGNYDS